MSGSRGHCHCFERNTIPKTKKVHKSPTGYRQRRAMERTPPSLSSYTRAFALAFALGLAFALLWAFFFPLALAFALALPLAFSATPFFFHIPVLRWSRSCGPLPHQLLDSVVGQASVRRCLLALIARALGGRWLLRGCGGREHRTQKNSSRLSCGTPSSQSLMEHTLRGLRGGSCTSTIVSCVR